MPWVRNAAKVSPAELTKILSERIANFKDRMVKGLGFKCAGACMIAVVLI